MTRLRLEKHRTIANPHKYKIDPLNLLLDTIKHEQPEK